MNPEFLDILIKHHLERAKDAADSLRLLSTSVVVPQNTSAPIAKLFQERVELHERAASELATLLQSKPAPTLPKLGKVLRDHADTIPDQETKELVRVLARIAEGQGLRQAFGAPGDWGYGTPIGNALAAR